MFPMLTLLPSDRTLYASSINGALRKHIGIDAVVDDRGEIIPEGIKFP